MVFYGVETEAVEVYIPRWRSLHEFWSGSCIRCWRRVGRSTLSVCLLRLYVRIRGRGGCWRGQSWVDVSVDKKCVGHDMRL